MVARRIHTLLLLLAGSVSIAGCAYDDYGYGGVSVGAGSGYYDPYDDYAGYGGGYGWYDGYYYPGNGYYIYDRDGRRHRWNDSQRRYWEGRRHARRDDRNDRPGRWQGRGDRDSDNARPGRGNGQWDRGYTQEQRDAWRANRGSPDQGVKPGRNNRWGGNPYSQPRERWQGTRPADRSGQPGARARPDRPALSTPRPNREPRSNGRGGGRQSREEGAHRNERPD